MTRIKPSEWSRRGFLAAAALPLVRGAGRSARADDPRPSADQLTRLLASPVIRQQPLTEPVTVQSIELLRSGRVYLLASEMPRAWKR